MQCCALKQRAVAVLSLYLQSASPYPRKTGMEARDLGRVRLHKAIDEIDKTIDHLQKVKRELQGSDNQLRIANNKVDDISIKKLTKDNPTMQAMFEEIKKREEE